MGFSKGGKLGMLGWPILEENFRLTSFSYQGSRNRFLVVETGSVVGELFTRFAAWQLGFSN